MSSIWYVDESSDIPFLRSSYISPVSTCDYPLVTDCSQVLLWSLDDGFMYSYWMIFMIKIYSLLTETCFHFGSFLRCSAYISPILSTCHSGWALFSPHAQLLTREMMGLYIRPWQIRVPFRFRLRLKISCLIRSPKREDYLKKLPESAWTFRRALCTRTVYIH